MREIRFRGKRIDNGEFVYGYFYMPNTDDPLRKWYGQTFIHSRHGDIVEVIHETVGQYTGLLDENGKEIYMGDIVRAFLHNETPLVFEITERHGVLWFGNWNWIEFQNVFRNLKVIGNVHDHPHLPEVS